MVKKCQKMKSPNHQRVGPTPTKGTIIAMVACPNAQPIRPSTQVRCAERDFPPHVGVMPIIVYICVNVLMSLWARTTAPDDWL